MELSALHRVDLVGELSGALFERCDGRETNRSNVDAGRDQSLPNAAKVRVPKSGEANLVPTREPVNEDDGEGLFWRDREWGEIVSMLTICRSQRGLAHKLPKLLGFLANPKQREERESSDRNESELDHDLIL
jgi:hypothetical protein